MRCREKGLFWWRTFSKWRFVLINIFRVWDLVGGGGGSFQGCQENGRRRPKGKRRLQPGFRKYLSFCFTSGLNPSVTGDESVFFPNRWRIKTSWSPALFDMVSDIGPDGCLKINGCSTCGLFNHRHLSLFNSSFSCSWPRNQSSSAVFKGHSNPLNVPSKSWM